MIYRILQASFLVVIVSMGCMKKSHEPKRPKTVPPDALWAGGADGGSFIKCSLDEKTNSFLCKVYNDFNGELVTEGHYKVRGQQPILGVSEFKYSGFDGKKIYLTNGSILEPEPDVIYHGK